MVLRRNKKATKSSRASLDTSQVFDRVQKKAYDLYERKGYSHGNDWNDWFEAERQVKKELGIR